MINVPAFFSVEKESAWERYSYYEASRVLPLLFMIPTFLCILYTVRPDGPSWRVHNVHRTVIGRPVLKQVVSRTKIIYIDKNATPASEIKKT